MGTLRVIGVERNSVGSVDTQNVFACIYLDGVYYLYGAEDDELISDYFSDADMLDYFVDSGKYEWSNFYIDKGQKISRNRFDEILVDDEQIDSFAIVNPDKQISLFSTKIFYEFLKTRFRGSEKSQQLLTLDSNINVLQDYLQKITNESVNHDISDFDKEIIVNANIKGYTYIIERLKEIMQESHGDFNEVYYFFLRLFKLETDGYIKVQ